MINLVSTAAWLAAANKQLERIKSWPSVDPGRQAALEEFAESLEKVGMKLIEAAEEIKKNG